MSKAKEPRHNEQLVPYNAEAEEAVIGSLLLSPECIDRIPYVQEDDFFIVRNGWIMGAIRSLQQAGQPVDYLTVCDHLTQSGRLSEAGGAAYVLGLINKTPSAYNVEGYAEIVRRTKARRMLIEHAQLSARLAHSDDSDIATILDKVDESAGQVRLRYASKYKPIEMVSDVAADLITELCSWRANGVVEHGIMTGLQPFDRMARGLRRNKLYVICGDSGMGKSTLLGRIALGAAQNGMRILFYALEMTAREITSRMACQLSSIAWNDVEDNILNDEDFDRYIAAIAEVERLPIGFCCEPNLTVEDYRSKTTRFQMEKWSVDMVIVDTLNLARAPAWAGKDANQRMAAKSTEMKNWAQDDNLTNATFLAAHQLRKPSEQARRPTKHDIRGASEQINNADGIYAVDRPWEYASDADKEKSLSDCPPAELRGLKNRMDIWQLKARGTGEAGDKCTLYFHGATFSIHRRTTAPTEGERTPESAQSPTEGDDEQLTLPF